MKRLTGWIPARERLPEKGVSVLITTTDGEVDMDSIDADGKWIWGEGEYGVLAWMPPPEPYESDGR